MKVTVERYDPNWTDRFRKEEQLLKQQLSDVEATIEHIGSTAVEGLCAKPTIDMMIGLKQFEMADRLIDSLEALGYEYMDRYNDVMPHRRFFQKSKDGVRTHHIHMVEVASDFWVRHLRFRDHLRECKEDRDRYAQLKMQLAERDWNDRNEYALAKTGFIRMIEEKAAAMNTP